MMFATCPTTPYLKYPGGKRKLVPQIADYYQPYRTVRFVDAFGGSAAVSLGLQPSEVLVNDINEHVVNLHRWVQRGWANECSTEGVGVEFRYDRNVFLRQRYRFNELIRTQQHQTLEAAMLLYYLNRTCFNGLMRFNLDGLYNGSFGRYATVRFLESFQPWRQAFSGWSLSAVDFASVELRPTDFVYADPPYDWVEDTEEDTDQLSIFGIEHQGQFDKKFDALNFFFIKAITEFKKQSGKGFVNYSGAFGWDQQVNLAFFLARHPGPVLISNAATHRIVKLYTDLGFRVDFLEVRRSISNTGDRPMAQEVFAFKEAMPCQR